jgi:alanine-synthesizing transaminase
VLTLTFNSLSKSYRSCGYRAGWLVVSGDKKAAADYIEGLTCSRTCACAPTCRASGPSRRAGRLPEHQRADRPGGRLRRQRDVAYELITAIPGVSCVKPQAALLHVPALDPKMYPIADDRQFFLELLQETRGDAGAGLGLQLAGPEHFRIVFLPHEDDLREAVGRIARFLDNYRKRHSK